MTGYFGGYSSGEDGLTGLGPAECAAAKQIAADAGGRKPVAVQSIFPDAPACRILADDGVPVFAAIEDAAAALAATAVEARSAIGRADAGAGGRRSTAVDYSASRAAFAAAGVPFVPAREVSTPDELREAAERAAAAVRAQGAGPAPQVRRRRGRGRAARTAQALVDGARPAGRAARPAGVLRRGDGRPAQRRRADRRRQVGPALRPDGAGRHGRHRHRGPRRRPGRARARRRAGGGADAASAAYRCPARRAPGSAGAGRRRRGPRGGRAQPVRGRPPRDRGVRGQPAARHSRPARSPSTPASSPHSPAHH